MRPLLWQPPVELSMQEEDIVKRIRKANGLTQVVPFLLESKLIERGAKYEKAPLFHAKVVVDNRLVTGQNPASAEGVGRAVAELLQEK